MPNKLTDEEYLNDFHKKWNESLLAERERTLSMRFSHEYLKAQSQRLAEQVRQQEEQLKKKKKEG